MKNIFFLIKTLIIACFLALTACVKENVDPVTGKKIEPWEPNSDARARKYADENPILIIGGKDKKNAPSETEFNTSNVLWRATLKSLDFLPLQNTDYRGGIIVYDWYSQTSNPKEQIKISVQFLSNELRSDSIKVIAHKKICDTANRCSNSTLDQNFANSVKDSIIISARTLKIEEAKKEKK
jgi:hypothetical protein